MSRGTRELLFLVPGRVALSNAEFEEVITELMVPRKSRRLVRHLFDDHGVIVGPALDAWLQGLPEAANRSVAARALPKGSDSGTHAIRVTTNPIPKETDGT